MVFFLDPFHKGRPQIPQLRIAQHDLLQLVAVAFDQLAGQQNKARQPLLKAAVQQRSQLCGIGSGRRIAKLVSLAKSDACLSGIGYDKTETRIVCQCQIAFIVIIGLDAAGNHVHHLRFHALYTADNVGIHAILTFQPVAHTLRNRLHHHNTAIKSTAVVELLQHPVHEATQKTTFTKLNDPFRSGWFGKFFIYTHAEHSSFLQILLQIGSSVCNHFIK